MLRFVFRTRLSRPIASLLLAPASRPCALRSVPCSRPLSSASSWRPGSKKPFADASLDDEDEEEMAARKAHEAREAAWKAEQAAEHDRKQASDARKRNASSSSSSSSSSSPDEPSILEQLHLSSKSAPRRSSLPADAAPSAEPTLAADPAPAPGSPLPTLKNQLRAFFLLSHPDFFESHPREKATNAASLALLSDFLDVLRGKSAGPVGSDARKTAKVQFWIRKKVAEGAPEPAAGAASFFSVSSTLLIDPTSKGQQQQLYASLSSLFKQAGIKNATHWRWGDEYEQAAGAGSDTAASDAQSVSSSQKSGSSESFAGFEELFARHTDSSGSPASVGGSLDAFLRAERARAHHFEYASRPARHEFLLRMANLRLQGVRVVFEVGGGGVELDQAAQKTVLGIFEDTLRKSRYFKPPRPITVDPLTDAAAAEAANRASPTPHGHAGSATDTDGGFEPQQPTAPFSQSVKMPDGFAGIFQQMKRHAIKEEEQQGVGQAAKAHAEAATGSASADATAASSTSSSAATPDSSFESRRSPFSRVASVISSDPSVRHCHVDGRGRLMLSLHEPSSAWLSFIDSSPLLIDAALATQRNYRGIKTMERQAADAIGLFDLFAEPALMQGGPVGAYAPLYAPIANRAASDPSLGSSPSTDYQSFLTMLHRDAHQMHSLRAAVKDLSEVSLRVFVPPVAATDSPSSAASPVASALFSVDPVFGLLLVPLTASVADLKAALLDRGSECVAIRRRQLEEVTELHDAMLHAKRHLKLRALTQASTVTREQMLECVQRMSRLFGSMRDLLQATAIDVGTDFDLREDDGSITIPWNWS